MQTATHLYKDLVLVGGGHSHALVIKMWAMQPLPGVRVTLVSPQALTPYSGMLPGLVAGHYELEHTHIDLPRLCQAAGVRFIQDTVVGIDSQQREILFNQRPPLGFDCVSINTGITPELSVPGSAQYSIPVKPIASFYPRWLALRDSLRATHADTPLRLAVVGGGAAGVEIVLAMAHAIDSDPAIQRPVQCRLVQRGNGQPEGYPKSLQVKMAARLRQAGVEVSQSTEVVEVKPNGLLIERDRREEFIEADRVFWCTQARASDWPAQSGLRVDDKGFIAINENLQSCSHDFVFATGDTAMQLQTPRPRAGVYAVRQGPVLFENLRRYLLQRPLKVYKPQSGFLSLLACGERWALGTRADLPLPTVSGAWVWRWKDRIDRRFMAMFSDLDVMEKQPDAEVPEVLMDASQIREHQAMRCGGCGAKVGSAVLSRVLARLQVCHHDGVVLGLDSPDDAAAIRTDASQLLLQSVDVFRALLDDPYLLGKIAAEHALSDLFAMNAKPHSALAIATLPFAAETLVERDLLQLLSGAVSVLNANQCALIGGHTSEGLELSMGFAVNGCVSEQSLLRKNSTQPGHQLILTQPLGTGSLFAAFRQLQAKGQSIEAAIDAMLLSNRSAGEIFADHMASACTDVTGFGLLGHLVEMLKPAEMGATLCLESLPILAGAAEAVARGFVSSLQGLNQRLEYAIADFQKHQNHAFYPLLFDPQTSGGLLASVPAPQARDCLERLQQNGYPDAVIIGEVTEPANCGEGRVQLS